MTTYFGVKNVDKNLNGKILHIIHILENAIQIEIKQNIRAKKKSSNCKKKYLMFIFSSLVPYVFGNFRENGLLTGTFKECILTKLLNAKYANKNSNGKNLLMLISGNITKIEIQLLLD